MSFWVREIVGWLLLLLGLFLFYVCLAILLTPGPHLLESGPIALIGIFVFRGGLHFLKVAVAARVAMRAQRLAERSVVEPVGLSRNLLERKRKLPPVESGGRRRVS
jgi:hypothetical protein